MAQAKKILLHIGQHKTGTSSIQRFFDQASGLLRDAGIIYPTLGRSDSGSHAPGHHGLAKALHRRVNRGTSPEFEELIAGIRREFDESGGHTMLISSEDIYMCPRPQIVQMVFPEFDVDIYVSLRPQHEMIGAMYYTAATGEKFDIAPEAYYEERLKIYCDYLARMDLWRSDYPHSVIHARIYESGQDVRKDAVADILTAFKLPVAQTDLPPIKREHPTLPARGLQLLRAATHLGFSPQEYYLLFQALHTERKDLGTEMSAYPPSFRAAIYETFRKGNRDIRRKYIDGVDADLFTQPKWKDDASWYEDVGDINSVVRRYLIAEARKKLIQAGEGDIPE